MSNGKLLRQLIRRERLPIVSALTPETDTVGYLDRFRERSRYLFRDYLHDETDAHTDPAVDRFSFDPYEKHTLHEPHPIIWTRGLAAGASLRDLEETPMSLAYTEFLNRLDRLIGSNVE